MIGRRASGGERLCIFAYCAASAAHRTLSQVSRRMPRTDNRRKCGVAAVFAARA
ncbi:hypothetical protein BMA10247_0950 [Burkholderia mallei NCTC 10247]|nr:hypothetical protein BMA10247_0950 [Burkholderia mallei NCTC 10247]